VPLITNAAITWNTNELATSYVQYGTTTGYGRQTPINTTYAYGHLHTITGLTGSTLYHYRVVSTSSAGATVYSTDRVFTTAVAPPDVIPPTAPTGLAAVAISPANISLSWTAATDNMAVVGYKVFRLGILIGTTTTTWYNDSGLNPSTGYSYTVSAYDAVGNNGPISISASAFTPGDSTPPSAPTGLNATAFASGVDVNWTAATDNGRVAGYHIYRNNVYLATTSLTNYDDITVSPATLYAYNVSAYDGSANIGPRSSAAYVTTLGSMSPPPVISALQLEDSHSVTNASNAVSSDFNYSVLQYATTGYRCPRGGFTLYSTPVFCTHDPTGAVIAGWEVLNYSSTGVLATEVTVVGSDIVTTSSEVTQVLVFVTSDTYSPTTAWTYLGTCVFPNNSDQVSCKFSMPTTAVTHVLIGRWSGGAGRPSPAVHWVYLS
jgi:hypothetical protein